MVAAYLVFAACATGTSESTMDRKMKALIGRNISDVIAEKSVYPDSMDLLPNGDTVYRFATGSGGSIDQHGNFVSNICKVWLEAKPDGVIVRYRYENCR